MSEENPFKCCKEIINLNKTPFKMKKYLLKMVYIGRELMHWGSWQTNQSAHQVLNAATSHWLSPHSRNKFGSRAKRFFTGVNAQKFIRVLLHFMNSYFSRQHLVITKPAAISSYCNKAHPAWDDCIFLNQLYIQICYK